MNEAIHGYLARLRETGFEFTIADPLLFEGICRGRGCNSDGTPGTRTVGGVPLHEETDREGGIFADHATFSVGSSLPEALQLLGSESRVLELGCGTGLLALFAARSGFEVVATDVDDAAVELTRKNAEKNGVTVDARAGSLLEPIRPGESFDLVIANLPHKPDAIGQGLWERGGEEGDTLFGEVVDRLDEVLTPTGSLLFFLHSLPHPRLLSSMGRLLDMTLCSWKLRMFERDEFSDRREILRSRHDDGRSFIHEEDGETGMVACVWHGVRRGEAH